MQKQKTVIRYLPGGMKLAHRENQDMCDDGADPFHNKPKSKNKKKPKPERNTSFSEDETNVNRQQFTHKWLSENTFDEFSSQNESPEKDKTVVENSITSPPKIICKNRSIPLDDPNLIQNVNSIFDVDITSINLPELTISDQSNLENKTTELNETSETIEKESNFKSKLLQLVNKHKKNQHNINKETETPQKITTNPEFDNLTNKENWWKTNTIFNEVNGESTIKKGLPLLKTDNTNKPVEITKIIKNEIIIHGTVIPKPVNTLQKTYFDENVLAALELMQFTSVRVMQSYMWPAILRGLNVFMIGPQKCGKTLSYVPAICTFSKDISEKYGDFSIYSGPLILILCTTETKCKEIYCVINSLTTARVEMLTNMSSVEDCDIVVAVQSDLEKCLKSEMITLKRLCHLVLEDADKLLVNHSFMANFLKTLDKMQENRPHNKNIQVIATAEKWTADLGTLMLNLYTTPIVCFQDFLRAALYSKVNFTKKKLNAAHKRFHLEDILKQRYSINKSIVFCSPEEISEVSEYLEMKGIECISISNDLLEDEIFENEDMWCSLTIGRFKVLLCTDELFKKTERIDSANWVIHYTPPKNWDVFQQRFKALGANIACPVEDVGEYVAKNCSYMLMVVDKKSPENHIFNDFFNELITSQIHYLKL